MMAGQDVGVNRGTKASIGLWFMGKSFGLMSQATLAKTFMRSAAGNQYLDRDMIAGLVKSGTFFKHSG